jgi:hypothetical protein
MGLRCTQLMGSIIYTLVTSLQLVYSLLPLGVLRTSCNLSSRVWTLVFHQRTRSVCGTVRLAYPLVIGYTFWVLLSEIFCCSHSLLFHSCGIPRFFGRFLDKHCLCTPRLLGCGSRSCHNCGISSFGHCTCFLCRLLVIVFICCCTHLHYLQICLLYPLNLILSSA